MKPNDAKELIKMAFDAGLKIPFNFVGPKGCGKSDVVFQAVEELRKQYAPKTIGLLDIRLALDTAEDVGGYPRIVGDSLQYLMADWAKETFKYDYCVVFFDEINRSPLETRQALFELLSKGSIRRKPINEKHLIICAMNPDNGEYQVESLDSAFQRRMIMIPMEPDRNGWLTWAKTKKINKDVFEFISANEKMLFVEEPEFNIITKPNSDAWRMVSEVLEKMPDMDRKARTVVISGIVGKEAALAFNKFLESEAKPMSAKELFVGWPETRDELLKRKNDNIVVTMSSIQDFMEETKNHTDKNIDMFLELVKDGTNALPREFAVSLFVKIGKELAEAIKAREKKLGNNRNWVNSERFAGAFDKEDEKKDEGKKEKS